MNSKKSKNELLGPGMELIRGGIDLPAFNGLCCCSDINGAVAGAASGGGCACSTDVGDADTVNQLATKSLQAAAPID